jgi:hypothetical protein
MAEDQLVATAQQLIADILPKKLEVQRGEAILYRVTVDNRLDITVNPKNPARGQSAFQTDLCIFERIAADVRLPRVVVEFKPGLSTHDVLTYSTKARKHKQVYPYLRYGLVTSRSDYVPGRFFTHNEALDFCIAAGTMSKARLRGVLQDLLKKEIAASRMLENITFGKTAAMVYRAALSISP